MTILVNPPTGDDIRHTPLERSIISAEMRHVSTRMCAKPKSQKVGQSIIDHIKGGLVSPSPAAGSADGVKRAQAYFSKEVDR